MRKVFPLPPAAAPRVRRVPLFAIRHCEAALQKAQGRVRSEQHTQAMMDRYEREHERALRYLIKRSPTQ
jgi:hypothetical protein